MSQAQTLTPVALYARNSSTNQGEQANRSLQAQLDAMRNYSEEHHMRPVSWSFRRRSDAKRRAAAKAIDRSGSREEFDWMMAQATSDNPPFRTILVHSFDRLTRSATEMSALLEELTANGLEVISIREPRNPSTLA